MEKGKVVGLEPKMVDLKASQSYAWCACGKSEKQPWCDGSHKGSVFSPLVFNVDAPKTAAMCMCKQTKNPPYCDGSHKSIETVD